MYLFGWTRPRPRHLTRQDRNDRRACADHTTARASFLPSTHRVNCGLDVGLNLLSGGKNVPFAFPHRCFERRHEHRPSLLDVLQHAQAGADNLADIVEPTALNAIPGELLQLLERWLGESEQSDKWNPCLMRR